MPPIRETRAEPPRLPKLPWRHNRTKRVLARAIAHAISLVAGIALIAGVGEGGAMWAGFALVAISIGLAVSALRVGPSSCPSCGGALELEPVRHLRARVVLTTATCGPCSATYEYFRQQVSERA